MGELEFFWPTLIIMLFPKDKTIHELLPQQITDGYADKPCCKKLFFYSTEFVYSNPNRHISIFLIHTLRECIFTNQYDRIYSRWANMPIDKLTYLGNRIRTARKDCHLTGVGRPVWISGKNNTRYWKGPKKRNLWNLVTINWSIRNSCKFLISIKYIH